MDEAELQSGAKVDMESRDGRIEITVATVPIRVVKGIGGSTIETDADLPALTAAIVRDTLERSRR